MTKREKNELELKEMEAKLGGMFGENPDNGPTVVGPTHSKSAEGEVDRLKRLGLLSE